MKKLISLVLALVFVLSLSTAAFAEEVEWDGEDHAGVVKKNYVVSNGTAPAETFNFEFTGESYENASGEVVAGAAIPEINDLTISFDPIAATTEKTVSIPVNANDYELGVYTYKVTEVNNETQGVTYATTPLYLVLTILRDEDSNKHYVAAVHYESATSENKTDGFENTYESGSLSVTKEITGNMADMDKEFAFTITFTGVNAKSTVTVTKPDGTTETKTFTNDTTLTYTIDLGDGETVKFDNLPAGVTYTVTEAADGYTESSVFSDETKTIADKDQDTAVFTNDLTTGVDNGIVLDSMPYVLLLAVAVFGMAMMTRKRRTEN